MKIEDKIELIKVAKGEAEADLLLSNINLVFLQTNEVYCTSVAIAKGRIAAIGKKNFYKAKKELDLQDKFLLPGFIEGHFHIESSLLHPAYLAEVLIKHGTTTVVADPHEIVNVAGKKGLEFMIKATENSPVDFYFMLPSCVPASEFETSGATFTSQDMKYFLEKYNCIIGLAEVMNYPGVIKGDEELLEKICIVEDKLKKPIIDGHAPTLSGNLLNAYIAAGIYSDHEVTCIEEGEEKLRLGMYLMLRQGSLAKNAKDLATLVNSATYKRCILVSDDKDPIELTESGHIDYNLRVLVKEAQIDPMFAISMVTHNPAEYFKLNDRGLIAPGYTADLVVVKDLHNFEVEYVIKRGEILLENKELKVKSTIYKEEELLNTVNAATYSEKDLILHLQPQKEVELWVISLIPGQLITKAKKRKLKTDKEGRVILEDDILYCAVIERHKRTGNIGLGLIEGFGLKEGAFGATVAHDSHNIIIVGNNSKDMLLLKNVLEEYQGGFAYVCNQKIESILPLPVGGLMSLQPSDKVASQLKNLESKLKEKGVSFPHPAFSLSFLSLSVIPQIKLTDKGLVKDFKFISPVVKNFLD